MIEDFGLFLGVGVTRPAWVRMRLIVDSAGLWLPSVSSRALIEDGPASSPAEVSCVRRSTMRDLVASVVCLGFE